MLREKHRIRQVSAQWRLETTTENVIFGQNCSKGEPKTNESVFYARVDVLLMFPRIFSCWIAMTAMKSNYFKVGGGATDLTLDGMKFPHDQVHCHVINSQPLQPAKKSVLQNLPVKIILKKHLCGKFRFALLAPTHLTHHIICINKCHPSFRYNLLDHLERRALCLLAARFPRNGFFRSNTYIHSMFQYSIQVDW